MNRDETKKAIEVMQACLDGETIQHRAREGSEWIDNPRPMWHWGLFEYRIKAKPREGWIHTCRLLDPKKFCPDEEGYIKVREVIE